MMTGCAATPDVNLTSQPAVVSVRNIAVPSTDLFEPMATLGAAQTALESGNYAAARAGFQNVLLSDKNNELAMIGFGNSTLALGDFDTALQTFQSLKLGTPAHVSGLVLAEIMTGQSADIELRLNEALEKDTSDPRLWNALGRYFDDQKRPLLAQDNYLKAMQTGRASAGAVNNLGMSYLMAGRRPDALAKFEHAQSMDPRTLLYDNNRRLTLALEGLYRRSVKGLPDERAANILNDAGYIAKLQGNKAAARDLFKAAISTSPHHHVIALENLESLKTPSLNPR